MKEQFNSSFLGIFSAILAFFSPISIIVHALIFIILLDCITAIFKAWKDYKPISSNWFRKFLEYITVIKSRKLKKTVLKFFFYILFIMAIYLAEIAIFARCLYITNFAAFILIFSELISVAENLDILLVTNKFTSLIKRIRKMFENKIIDKISNTVPEESENISDSTQQYTPNQTNNEGRH